MATTTTEDFDDQDPYLEYLKSERNELPDCNSVLQLVQRAVELAEESLKVARENSRVAQESADLSRKSLQIVNAFIQEKS